jgi:protoporphyrinogen oxidase
MDECLILGAGVTGLSLGISTGKKIFEANDIPGGICASYYMHTQGDKHYFRKDEETYRFEIGGGHWIFGADDATLDFIAKLTPIKKYERRSAVYFPNWDLYVPYPLQNNLSYLQEDIAQKALNEIVQSDHTKDASVLGDWLELHFGKTLCDIFFFPFHELYTAGLFYNIEPQDKYKTPVDIKRIIKGFNGETSRVGYNAIFIYPKRGLDVLVRKMAEVCAIDYQKEVIEIDTKKREILFNDGNGVKYDTLISTLPLNKVIKLTKALGDKPELPYTSVLVINIGAKKGRKCPIHHWLYIPNSQTGFHRVGFYSNVDQSFLPRIYQEKNEHVSIYVEKAFLPQNKPNRETTKGICNDVLRELQSWEFITETEIVDPIWIEVAYTWSLPESTWKQRSLEALQNYNIFQLGRYGRWQFQGIAESLKDGICISRLLNKYPNL